MIIKSFSVSERTPDVFRAVNRYLAANKFANVSVEDVEGSLETVRYADGTVKRHYKLNSIILECEKQGEKQYDYQLSTAVSVGKNIPHNRFNSWWRGKHPDRVMRCLLSYGFEDTSDTAYVILHHPKPEEATAP